MSTVKGVEVACRSSVREAYVRERWLRRVNTTTLDW